MITCVLWIFIKAPCIDYLGNKDIFTLITLTTPYLTKSNKQAFLLAHARSVFDDVINQTVKHIYWAQYTAPRSS